MHRAQQHGGDIRRRKPHHRVRVGRGRQGQPARLLLRPEMIEHALIDWDSVPYGEDRTGEPASPLDLWMRMWSRRLRSTLWDTLCRGRLTGQAVALDLRPEAIGYLVCRLAGLRRMVRILVAAERSVRADGSLWSTLPETWEAVLGAVNRATPYPLLLRPAVARELDTWGLLPENSWWSSAQNLPPTLDEGSEVLVIAPIGEIADWDAQLRASVEQLTGNRRAKVEQMRASLRITLPPDVAAHVRSLKI